MPAVIYGAKQTPTLVSLDPRAVMKELTRGGWRSRLYEVKIDGRSERALLRDVQLHPVTDKPEHVDFQRLAPGERIRVAVAVHFTNELISPGLKRGGVLNVVRHGVDCMVDPDHVPEFFEADLSTLDINDNVRWSDLKNTAETRPTILDRDFVIATVAAPTKAAEVAVEPGAAPVAAPAGGTKAPGKAPAGKAPAAAKAPAKPASKK